jgi:iron(III) transport system substrate-binding protein
VQAVGAIATVGLLAACGVGSESATNTTASTNGVDDGSPGTTAVVEPIDIDAAIEASHDENTLVVYGNPSADQWTPVLEAFNEAYPWIEVETFDLSGAEAFQRYLTEEATGSATADVIVNTDGAGWLDLVSRGQVVDYVDPELADLPDEAVLAPGVFALSYDPLIAVFNKRAFPEDEQPTSLAELADQAEDLDGQIGTVNVENANAGLGTYGYVEATGEDGWDVLEQLGAHALAEDGTGELLGKLNSGEYVAGFFASGSLRALIEQTETGDLLNYRYFSDATTLPARGMGVTTAADSPNAARVLIHWLLSEDGQVAACGGGFTPYRDDVDCPTGLPAIEEAVGEGNAILVGYPDSLTTDMPVLVERWNEAFGR